MQTFTIKQLYAHTFFFCAYHSILTQLFKKERVYLTTLPFAIKLSSLVPLFFNLIEVLYKNILQYVLITINKYTNPYECLNLIKFKRPRYKDLNKE